MTLRFARHPVDAPITGGYREVYSNSRGTYEHRGIDYGCPSGTPIVNPSAGRATVWAVHHVGDGWGDGSFGTCIILDHPATPWFTLYAHLSGANVAAGDVVQRGQIIGLSGDSGFTFGTHLHWQLSSGSYFPADFAVIANPLDYLVEEDMTEEQVRAIVREELRTAGLVGPGVPTLARLSQAIGARIAAMHIATDPDQVPGG